MSILSKIFIVLLVVLTIALSVAVVIVQRDYLAYKTNSEVYKGPQMEAARQAFTDLQTTSDKSRQSENLVIAGLSATVAELQDQVARGQNNLKDAEAKISDSEQKLRNSELQVTQLTAMSNRNAEERKTFEAELTALRTKYDALAKDYSQVSQKLSETDAQKQFLLRQVDLQKEEIELLKKQLAEATSSNPKSTARVPGGEVLGATIKGHVTGVSEDLATVDVGKADGVQPGMRFTVFRGPNYLAELVVTRVEVDSAAGRLELVKQRVQVNDNAWNKLEEN